VAKLQRRELEEDEEEEGSFEETRSQSKDQNVAVYGVVSKLYKQYPSCAHTSQHGPQGGRWWKLRFGLFFLQKCTTLGRGSIASTIVLALVMLAIPQNARWNRQLTQYFEIAKNARDRHPADRRNGAFAVPVIRTSHSAIRPATMATQVLEVVIMLKMALRAVSASSSMSLLNSATSQLSKTLHSSVPEMPPRTRPKKST
jgi:hypothetical protein